jgi:competence protein ComEC
MISLPVTVFLFFPASLFFLFAYELGTFPFKAFAFFNELHESYLLNLFSLSLRFYPIWVIRPEQFLISCAIAIPVFLSKKRAFFVFFFLCASLTRLPFSSPKIHPVAKKILALDVGQGDATCIQTQSDHWFMIDTGSKKSLRISEWLQIFFHYRIFSLSGIYFTHLDEDHCGATNLLSALIRIESLFFDPLWDNHPKTKTLFFLPLSLKPIFEYKTVFARQKNNAVMTGYRVFLPQNQIFISLGDASFEQENAFLPWILSSHKKIALLKISHHGSALSSSAEWIKKIHPEKAWISVGRNNPYGHPHPRVCNTLEQNGIVFFRTDLSGALLWTFTKSGLQ